MHFYEQVFSVVTDKTVSVERISLLAGSVILCMEKNVIIKHSLIMTNCHFYLTDYLFKFGNQKIKIINILKHNNIT